MQKTKYLDSIPILQIRRVLIVFLILLMSACANEPGEEQGDQFTYGVNIYPSGVIETPLAGGVVKEGDLMTFVGSESSELLDNNLTFVWDFGDYAPKKVGKQVSVRAHREGQLKVSLLVIDQRGAADPNPPELFIDILAKPSTTAIVTPNGVIDTPSRNVSIIEGEAVTFRGSGFGVGELFYNWTFSGGIPESNTKFPGAVTFNLAGVYRVKLTVTDAFGVSDPTPDTVMVTVSEKILPLNTPPVASIIAPSKVNNIHVGDSLRFVGAASDTDGDSLTYQWDFGASGVQKSSLLSPGLKVFNKAGVYVVSFNAIDPFGLTNSIPKTITINVSEPVVETGLPPNGNILGLTTVNLSVGNSYTFEADATDPDGVFGMEYHWNFGTAAPNYVGKKKTIKFTEAETIEVSMTAIDNTGLEDPVPAKVKVIVSSILSVNSPPDTVITSPLSNVTIQRGDSISFSASGFDPDGSVNLSYVWDFDGALPNSTSQNPGELVFDTAGFYVVTVTASDELGLADISPAVKYINVVELLPDNIAPESLIENPPADMTISIGDTVNFGGTGHDANGDLPLSFYWDFDGAFPNSSEQTPGELLFDTAGIYRVTLTATDAKGKVDLTPDTRIIRVEGNVINTIPNANIVSPDSSLVINVGDSVIFNGSGSSTDSNAILNYSWDFDGAVPNSNLRYPGSIIFENSGVYNVSLRVSDQNGMQDPTPDYVQIIVQNIQAINEAPNSLIVSPSMDMTINEGESINFEGLGIDPDGDAMTHHWDFDGVTLNSLAQSPGVVEFPEAGVYRIRYTATDEYELSDPTPAERIIRVKSITPTNIEPNGIIVTPVSDQVITVGDSLAFLGVAEDVSQTHSYYWNFDGASAGRTVASPGEIVFNTVGVYDVQLTVTNSFGIVDSTPALVRVTVEQGEVTAGDGRPESTLVSPSSGTLNVDVGDTYTFEATAVDPEGETDLFFLWDFQGYMPNKIGSSVTVTFNAAGSFRMKLIVEDSLRNAELIPKEIFVVVN